MTEMLHPTRGMACLPGCDAHTGGHSTGDEHAECIVHQPIGSLGGATVAVTLVRDWETVGAEIAVYPAPTEDHDPEPVVMDVREARSLAEMLTCAARVAETSTT